MKRVKRKNVRHRSGASENKSYSFVLDLLKCWYTGLPAKRALQYSALQRNAHMKTCLGQSQGKLIWHHIWCWIKVHHVRTHGHNDSEQMKIQPPINSLELCIIRLGQSSIEWQQIQHTILENRKAEYPQGVLNIQTLRSATSIYKQRVNKYMVMVNNIAWSIKYQCINFLWHKFCKQFQAGTTGELYSLGTYV